MKILNAIKALRKVANSLSPGVVYFGHTTEEWGAMADAIETLNDEHSDMEDRLIRVEETLEELLEKFRDVFDALQGKDQ